MNKNGPQLFKTNFKRFKLYITELPGSAIAHLEAMEEYIART